MAHRGNKAKRALGLHPRNLHRGRYDFAALCRSCPALEPFLCANPRGDRTVDFADPAAVRMLNRALLAHFYRIEFWQIPETYLCPPIPGRADYIHHGADLLAELTPKGKVPRGRRVRVLDTGTGANCIYPILGSCSYGWRFIGSDIDPVSIEVAATIVAANPVLSGQIELRLQADARRFFRGVLRPDEPVDLTLCNPPFHASAKEAAAGTRRKWRNLGREGSRAELNFGGQQAELWCPGGERAFLQQMIDESREFAAQVCWFSSLVSKAENLPVLQKRLQAIGAAQVRVVPMAQGQKQSRLLAWSFLDRTAQQLWAEQRWSSR